MASVSKMAVVGSMNLDMTVRVPRLPSPGETVAGDNLQRIPGGKSSNQAVAISKYGLASHLIACVGEDETGQFLLQMATSAGVHVEGVEQIPACQTGTAFIAVDDSAENFIVVIPGANARLSSEMVEHKLNSLGGYDGLILAMEVNFEAIGTSLLHARRSGAVTFLNASPMSRRVLEFLPMIDFLIVNEHELEQLFDVIGKRGPEGFQELRNLGGSHLVLTRGSLGATYFDLSSENADPVDFSTPKVVALDTTGCGDAFAGSLAAHYLSTKDISESMKFAVRAASYAALSVGAQGSYGNREAISDHFRSHSSLE